MHGDDAALNVVLFVTPDRARFKGGGLVVFGRPAPLHWDFAAPPSPERDAAIAAFLARSDNVTVGYRCNRAVLFDSNLFHRSDTFAFEDSFEGWRTSMTWLFGDRGRAAMSEGLGLI